MDGYVKLFTWSVSLLLLLFVRKTLERDVRDASHPFL